MASIKVLLTVALAASVLTAAPQLPRSYAQQTATPSGPTATTDVERVELAEDLSESLAADLVELSLAAQERNFERVARFFPPLVNFSPLPSRPRAAVAHSRWTRAQGWAADVEARAPVRPMKREEVVRDLSELLAHFAQLEDLRFALKEAEFADDARTIADAEVPTAAEGATGRARLSLAIVGRNREGKREWALGTIEASARKAESNWVFDSFQPASDFRSTTATTDIFSEVSDAAGVAVVIPPYGERGNDGQMHGAAAADFNNDGWVDIFATAPYRNYLYLNDGRGGFRDASEEAGVKVLATGVAPLALDYDQDGATDVFISNDGGQILLQNRLSRDGRLSFRDVSNETGVGAARAVGFSAAAGDVSGDGLPDIYVASYNHYGRVTPDSWFRATNGTPNLLLVNRGDGTFKDEAKLRGVDDSRWSYAAAIADADGDGKLDIYVGNDFGEKGLFINRGVRFADEARDRGVLDPANAMGIAFGDYNNDGRLDIHCTNMSSLEGSRILQRLFPGQTAAENVLVRLNAGNTLFEGDGRGRFRDVSAQVGGLPAGWAWGGGFMDFDNDGWEDLYSTNGYVSGRSRKDVSGYYWRLVAFGTRSASRPDLDRLMAGHGYSFAGHERDTLFASVAAGRSARRRFVNISGVSGLDSISDGRGAVFADFDNDGDYDLFVTTLQGRSHLLFRNNVGQQSSHLRVALEGSRAKGGSGREAYGSVVRVQTSQGTLTKVKAGGAGFISQHDPRLIFGLGQDARARSVEVAWASGRTERFRGVFAANTSVLLKEGSGVAVTLRTGRASLGTR